MSKLKSLLILIFPSISMLTFAQYLNFVIEFKLKKNGDVKVLTDKLWQLMNRDLKPTKRFLNPKNKVKFLYELVQFQLAKIIMEVKIGFNDTLIIKNEKYFYFIEQSK